MRARWIRVDTCETELSSIIPASAYPNVGTALVADCEVPNLSKAANISSRAYVLHIAETGGPMGGRNQLPERASAPLHGRPTSPLAKAF